MKTWESSPISLPPVPRTGGLHLSDVLNYMEITMGTDRGDDDVDYTQYRNLGFAWEYYLDAVLQDLVERPTEITEDGIIMTPDAIDMEGWVVEEWKATFKSIRPVLSSWPPHSEIDIDAFEYNYWRWFVQVKSYCRVMDTTRCRFRVLWINGTYAGSGPIQRVIEIDFTSRELEENWAMVTNNARHAPIENPEDRC